MARRPALIIVALGLAVAGLAAPVRAAEEEAPAFVPRPAQWYVISVTAKMPDGLTEAVAALDDVEVVSAVRVGTVALVETRDVYGALVDRAPSGYILPLEVHAIDAKAHSRYVPAEVARVLSALGPDEAVLSRSSAEFRDLGLGGTLRLNGGRTFTVIGVVADEWVGSAEAVVSPEGGAVLGLSNERYALVLHHGSTALLDYRVNKLIDEVVRVRARHEVDTFRHADAVASQIAIKRKFGEFAYRENGDGTITIDPNWVRENIVSEPMPLLGSFPCHREFAAMLRNVMTELVHEGNDDVIDRRRFHGCWNARFIRGRKDLSRHAWGVAVDLNFGFDGANRPGSATHPALIQAMLDQEILSGHLWSDPDFGHFEWFGVASEVETDVE